MAEVLVIIAFFGFVILTTYAYVVYRFYKGSGEVPPYQVGAASVREIK